MQRSRPGFTLVELMIVIIVIAILAGIVLASYGGWRHMTAVNVVKNDLTQASASLKNTVNFSGSYPATLSMQPSSSVVFTYKPNGTIQYANLTSNQNAQLFLNICNSVMPLAAPDGSQTYVTKCVGQWGVDITGGAHDSYLSTPIQSNFTISDNPSGTGSYYNPYNQVVGAASSQIASTFQQEGGTFPVTFQNNPTTTLPAPATNNVNGYCLEADSTMDTSVVYHISDSNTQPTPGTC